MATSIEPVAEESVSIAQEQLARFQELFPEVFSEGKVDLKRLRATLGDLVDETPDRYGFTWAGKRDAIRLLQIPSRATLIPDREASIAFDETQNVFIEGDNLEVLKLLYKSYFNRVKLIYIDPPYNTGNDFIYNDDFTDPLGVYLQHTAQQDSLGNLLRSNPDSSGRFHSAWLSMMYPRLFIARQLLRDDGVIFVSIDENELAHLRLLMNEVFGEENFIGAIIVQSNPRGRQLRKYIATAHEYLMVYGKNESETSLFDAPLTEQQKKDYREVDVHGQLYRLLGLRKRGAFSQRSERPNLHYPLYVDPETKGVFVDKEHDTYIQVVPKLSDGTDGVWRWSKPKVARERGKLEARIVAGRAEWDVFEKDYLMAHDSEKTTMYKSIWIDKGVNYEFGKQSLKSLFGRAPFDTPKPVMLLQKVLAMGARDDDIVMDFFAGSCTFCQAVLEQNRKDGGRRRFIAVQMPEPISDPEFSTIAAVGLERIRRVISAMANADEGKLPLGSDEDLGFRVFKLTESHIRLWRGLQNVDTAEYAQQMALFADPLQSGWQPEAVICEVAIREGFGLNCQVRQLEGMADNTVYRVHDPDKGQSFTICVDDHVTTDLVQDRLRLGRDDLFICRDVALDDETAANIALQCRVKTI